MPDDPRSLSTTTNDRALTRRRTRWLSEYVSLKEASKLLPSQSGKRLHLNTFKRWIRLGLLPAKRMCGFYYVRRGDVLAMLKDAKPKPEVKAPVVSERAVAADQVWADEILEETGLRNV